MLKKQTNGLAEKKFIAPLRQSEAQEIKELKKKVQYS